MKVALVMFTLVLCLAWLRADAEVRKAVFGTTPEGQPVYIFVLHDAAITARVMTYGGRLVSLEVPDRAGKPANIVLGHDSLGEYLADHSTFFGGLIGRYANRIAGGTFRLNGVQYHLPRNSGPNSLHGGTLGFDKRLWSSRIVPDGVELTLVSKNGDEGYPGTLRVRVRYTLAANVLKIDFFARTDADADVNLTSHSYFNLAGEGYGDILHQILTIPADAYTPTTASQIPTGQIAPVAGTPFDVRIPTAIGERVHEENEQLRYGRGYDINFVLHPGTGSDGLREAARVLEPNSGRMMVVRTTQPGLQFNSGNLFDGTLRGKHGHLYEKYASFCLEPQHFPDSPNHPNFPTTELRPGQLYHQTTEYICTVTH